jgi:hypothetical protein
VAIVLIANTPAAVAAVVRDRGDAVEG